MTKIELKCVFVGGNELKENDKGAKSQQKRSVIQS